MSRFVKPDVIVLPLPSGGDTITLKKRLTTGENRAMYARMYKQGITPWTVDPSQTLISQVAAYLVDWTLVDDSGSKVEIKGKSPEEITEIVDALDPDSFNEIKDMVLTHIDVQDALREDEKKTGSGTREPSVT